MSNALGVVVFLALFTSDDYCTAHLDRLLSWHREYGLPLPPPEAQLVQYVSEPTILWRDGKRVVEPGEPGLGFSLDGRTVLGIWNQPEEVASVVGVKPDPTTIGNDVTFGWISFAVACHERGWGPLARAALRRWTLANCGWDTEEVIARDAWHHWWRRLHSDPGTPLPLIAKYLNRALVPSGEDSEYNRHLLHSLDLALKPRTAQPGSDEALIDDLIELSGDIHRALDWSVAFRRDPRYRAIVRRGFDIVPALVAHLDDERLTRLVEKFGEREHLYVGDVALDILAQLNGGPFVVREDTPEARYAAVGKWIADAEKLGEERYVVSRVLGTENDEELKQTLFWLLCEKYPARVPEVYRDLIDNHPNLARSSWQVARAIAEGPLPADDKRKVLEHAASQLDPSHRCAGIHFLRPYDAESAHTRLLAALDALPTEPAQEEAFPAWVVAANDDPREWQALAKATRRADVGGRLELLFAVARQPAADGRRQRLAFLAEYLDDDAVMESEEGDPRRVFRSSDIAPGSFPRLEVRNFAALRLARMLQVEGIPDPEWTAAQWVELREKVRVAVAKELGR